MATPNGPSPAPATYEEIHQNGLGPLLEHNAADIYHPDQATPQSESRYGSPVYHQIPTPYTFSNESPYPLPTYQRQHSYNFASPSNYDNVSFGSVSDTCPLTTSNAKQGYTPAPRSSSATPAQPYNLRATRNGATIDRTLRSNRQTPSFSAQNTTLRSAPKPKKSSRAKKKTDDKSSAIELGLTIPLSELVETELKKKLPKLKDPFEEIEDHIMRPVETRRKERRDNKTKRPSNCFMLYRKAFQHWSKAWSGNANHQDVSKVCGASWSALEPQHVRDRFEELFRREKEQHALAFPDYKYEPAQNKAKLGKKNNGAEEQFADEEEEDDDILDPDWMSGSTNRSKNRVTRRSQQTRLYQPSQTALTSIGNEARDRAAAQSPYQLIQEHKTPSISYVARVPQDNYYQGRQPVQHMSQPTHQSYDPINGINFGISNYPQPTHHFGYPSPNASDMYLPQSQYTFEVDSNQSLPVLSHIDPALSSSTPTHNYEPSFNSLPLPPSGTKEYPEPWKEDFGLRDAYDPLTEVFTSYGEGLVDRDHLDDILRGPPENWQVERQDGEHNLYSDETNTYGDWLGTSDHVEKLEAME